MRLKSIISTQMEIESNKINLNSNFATDLGADELDGTELIFAVEEEFDIEIPDEYIANYTGLSGHPYYTMKDIFEYIISHKKQNI
ncbi:acyl carrier protein [Funiculus sociatus]|uniref:acyl carrier protein n=1 Tax=Funiculus sociatus TaxID=450527 RepID=UPI003D654936